MTNIQLAHFWLRSTTGKKINCAVFMADAKHSWERGKALNQMIVDACAAGLKVEKAVLVFKKLGQPNYYGAPDLGKYLEQTGLPEATHSIWVNF